MLFRVRAGEWIALGGATALATMGGCLSRDASSSCGDSPSCTTDRGEYKPPTSGDAGQGITCEPADLTDFTPVPITPLVKHVCTDAQIHSIAQGCAPGATQDDCNKALSDPANAPCMSANCIYSAYSATPATKGVNPIPPAQGPWGPIVVAHELPINTFGVPTLNLGACVAVFDPSRPDCAQSAFDRFQCTMAACLASCPPATSRQTPAEQIAASDAFTDCVMRAESTSGACQTYADVDNRCRIDLTVSNSPAAFCYSDFGSADPVVREQAHEKLFKQQCGLPPDGSVCLPDDVTNFQPAPLVEARIQAVCTDAQLQDAAASCLGPAATQLDCNAWAGDPANATCLGCFETTYSKTFVTPGVTPVPPPTGPWGPLLFVEDTKSRAYMLYNAAGCILAADPARADCAYAWEALYECEVTSCAAACALPDPTDPSYASVARAFSKCLDKADTDGCQSYSNAAVQKCAAVIEPVWLEAGTSPAGFCLSNDIYSEDPAVANPAFAKFLGAQCRK